MCPLTLKRRLAPASSSYAPAIIKTDVVTEHVCVPLTFSLKPNTFVSFWTTCTGGEGNVHLETAHPAFEAMLLIFSFLFRKYA